MFIASAPGASPTNFFYSSIHTNYVFTFKLHNFILDTDEGHMFSTGLHTRPNGPCRGSRAVFLNRWAVENFQWAFNLVILQSFTTKLYKFIII